MTEKQIESSVKKLKKMAARKSGVQRAEAMEAMGLSAYEWLCVRNAAMNEGALYSQGNKRGATYYLC